MAAKKFYAVKKGKTTGIFETWAECKVSVDGYSGAEYKGFTQRAEAESYLNGKLPLQAADSGAVHSRAAYTETVHAKSGRSEAARSGADDSGSVHTETVHAQTSGCESVSKGRLLSYVDGSYDDSLKKYAFGCVFLPPEGGVYVEYGNGDNQQSLQHRNVTGEMLGAMYAVKTAMLNGFASIEICYDYQGIEKWVTGEWRSKTELTQKYARSMREWEKSVKIYFTKVAAHSNVYYNELADKTAKRGLREGNGIPKVRRIEEMERMDEYGADEAE